jgi:hypothetical protein
MIAFPGVARTYTDQRRGVAERLRVFDLSGMPTVGVIASPAGPRIGFAWVICHSSGVEQSHLQPFEVSDVLRARPTAKAPRLRTEKNGATNREERWHEPGTFHI